MVAEDEVTARLKPHVRTRGVNLSIYELCHKQLACSVFDRVNQSDWHTVYLTKINKWCDPLTLSIFEQALWLLQSSFNSHLSIVEANHK